MALRTANTESGRSPLVPLDENLNEYPPEDKGNIHGADDDLSGIIEEFIRKQERKLPKPQIRKVHAVQQTGKSSNVLGGSVSGSSGSIDAKLSYGPTKIQQYFLRTKQKGLNYYDDFGYTPLKEGERLSAAFKRNFAGKGKPPKVYNPNMSEKDFAGLMSHISSQNPRNYNVGISPQYDGEIKADDRWVVVVKVRNPEGDQLNRDRLTVLREIDGRYQKAVLTKKDLKTVWVNGVEINNAYIMVGRGDINNYVFAGQFENAHFKVIKPNGKHQALYQKITFAEQKSAGPAVVN